MARSSGAEQRRLAVLHRPRRQGRRDPRRLEAQHLPDHRQRHVRDGDRRCDLRRRRRSRAAGRTPSRSRRRPSRTRSPARQGGHAHDQRHHRHRDRRHRGRPVRRERPEGDRELRQARRAGLLRRRHLPSRHPGLRRPGRRRPVRQEVVARARPGRDRRTGLQVRGRAGPGRLRPRVAGDGQRRAQHQRVAVLHLPPGPDRQAAEELHAVRPGDARHGRRGRHRRALPGTARTSRTIPSR